MREADKIGVARAWRIRHSKKMERAHAKSWGYESSSLADWIVSGPYHPFWSWWYIGLIHLRDIEGVPPANKKYPEAEYELMFLSLNPDPTDGRPKVPDVDLLERTGDAEKALPGFLTPADLVFQFDGVTEEQAIEIAERAVDGIVAGQSCDSDFRGWWQSSLATTVQHYRDGLHGAAQ